jgi:hypothetical protein
VRSLLGWAFAGTTTTDAIPVISSSEYKLVLAVIRAYSGRSLQRSQPSELTDEAQAI